MATIKSPNWDVHPHISTSMEYTMLSLSFCYIPSPSFLHKPHTFLCLSPRHTCFYTFIFSSLWGASRFPFGPHASPKVNAGEGNKVSEDTSLATVRMGRGRIYGPIREDKPGTQVITHPRPRLPAWGTEIESYSWSAVVRRNISVGGNQSLTGLCAYVHCEWNA